MMRDHPRARTATDAACELCGIRPAGASYSPLHTLLAITLLLAPGLAGCASQQLYAQRVQAYAQAGATYAESLPAVLDESLEATVEVDSLVLVTNRAMLNAEQRLEQWSSHTKALKERREIFRDLERHTTLLRSYFLSLSALASVNAESSGLLEVTHGLVGKLSEVGIDLAEQKLGGTTIGELLPSTTELVLGRFKSRALRRELERNAAQVERELLLQQSLLQSLAEIMEAELEAKSEAKLTDVATEFVDGPKPLNADAWSARRLAALRATVEASSVRDAARAAASLHRSFVALAEDRFDQANLSALVADVSSVLTTVRSITQSGS